MPFLLPNQQHQSTEGSNHSGSHFEYKSKQTTDSNYNEQHHWHAVKNVHSCPVCSTEKNHTYIYIIFKWQKATEQQNEHHFDTHTDGHTKCEMATFTH